MTYLVQNSREIDYDELCQKMVWLSAEGDRERAFAIDILTNLIDRRYDTRGKNRSSILERLEDGLYEIFNSISSIDVKSNSIYTRINWDKRHLLKKSEADGQILVIDILGFAPEGDDSASQFLVDAYRAGWRRFITYNHHGQRFFGCGLGPGIEGVRIDVYGSSGDYLGSGVDGVEMHIHGTAQDQVGQILKSGKLVIHGDVGQAFMYGAKGGEVYVLGNTAGRPLINAVGRPRVVINGTCLDYLAESFMAGDPLSGGGFVILNGVQLSFLLPQGVQYT